MILCLFVARGGLLMEKLFCVVLLVLLLMLLCLLFVLSNWDGEGNCQGVVVGVVD